MAAWRRRRAWAQAVLWLHDHGMAAAAPCYVAVRLRPRGIDADWRYRNAREAALPVPTGTDGRR
jgi:hypothetical protein